jgi:hypothetical protein
MTNDVIDAILDVDPELTKRAELKRVPEVAPATMANPESALENDLNYSRNKLKEIIDTAQITLSAAMQLAEDSDQPRAYEVVGTMIQAIVTANKEPLLLHKTKAETQRTVAQTTGAETGGKSGDTIIEKAVFIGRAQDLLRELKQIKKLELEQDK